MCKCYTYKGNQNIQSYDEKHWHNRDLLTRAFPCLVPVYCEICIKLCLVSGEFPFFCLWYISQTDLLSFGFTSVD